MINSALQNLAEGEGFEPPIQFRRTKLLQFYYSPFSFLGDRHILGRMASSSWSAAEKRFGPVATKDCKTQLPETFVIASRNIQ